nr:monodehydroascorbate reductase [Tanacetum cinerariifolium]
MADVNVNAPAEQTPTMAPATRTDDQILPRSRWVSVGKRNCYLDVEKDTTRCQLDEQLFDLTKDTLRDALQITPVNNNNSFSSPPTPDALINFVNNLGYLKVVRTLSAVMTNDMFQPWRALTTIINLCLMGKTSGFERPRAPVLQILWGIVNQAHIDYTKRMWEDFTQSIHSFVEDIKNLALHTQGKKKANPIVIPSIRFTKLITHHLQSKHKFHPRPDSPLHLPYEEYILGYLKFSAKGTKREVIEMPIPNELITADIQGGQYYKEYLKKVAKHQRYLAGKEGIGPDSPAPKPPKATKKSNPSASKADLRPPVTKPASSQQPKPKLAPAMSQEKTRKLVTKTSDKPSLAKRSKPGLVTKRRKPSSSLRSVDESVDEGIPEKEPRFDDEEADIQRAVEESLKSVHDAPRGPLPPVVIRELDSRKFQPLPEVQGKGKEKVSDGQVARDLLTLQTPKKVSPVEQYIFQGLTPASTEPSGHAESPLIYAELGLTDSDSKSDEEVPPVVKVGDQDEGQAGPNPNVLTKGQAGSDLDFSFGDLFFNDKPSKAENEKTTTETEAESMVSVTIQQDTSAIPPMTTPVIDLTSRPNSPNVHRPLQAMVTKTTMTTTTTHSPPPQPQQSTTDSMLIKRISKLRQIMENLIQDNKHLEERLDSHEAPHEDHMMLYKALEKSMNRDHADELLKDLAEARRKKKKRHDSPKTPPGSPPHRPLPTPPPAGPSGTSGSPRASGSSQLPPPPPPLSTSQSDQSKSTATPSFSKTVASAEYTAWRTSDTRLRSYVSSIPKDLHMDDDMSLDEQPLEEDRPATPEPVWSIPSADLLVPTNNWASSLASTYTPPPEHSLLAQTGDMAMFMDWFCKRHGITELKPQDLEGPAFELVKVFHPNAIHLQYQMEECHKLLTDSVDKSIIKINVSKPLPLGGPPGQVMIISDFFFNKDLEYLRYGSKGGRPALSISKMKAAYYPDVGLEQIVSDQIDGTLHQIDEALDYRVKEFKVNRMNLGLNTRFWTRKDVYRSKEFMFSIQKRLKTRRIFRNLESFVGGRVREGDYRLL